MIRRFRHRIAPIALLLVIASSCWAGGQKSPLNEFVETYRCRVVQHLRAIHEHGTRSYSHNRYLILEMTHSPQRFVQCIFYEYDSKLLCEASSGRYKLPPGQQYAIELSREGTAALARLGYAPPFQVANYSQEVAFGDPPDLEAAARLMLQTLYEVYGARLSSSMALIAPLLGARKTKLDVCKSLS